MSGSNPLVGVPFPSFEAPLVDLETGCVTLAWIPLLLAFFARTGFKPGISSTVVYETVQENTTNTTNNTTQITQIQETLGQTVVGLDWVDPGQPPQAAVPALPGLTVGMLLGGLDI